MAACAASGSAWRNRRSSRPSSGHCCAPRTMGRCGSCSRSCPRCTRSAPRKTLLAEARGELEARGVHTPDIPVGIMIEVPIAAFTASLLAREVDFFTIGTNDLIQYTLAVDRTDERVSNRYEPLHPAVLRLLRQVRRGAIRGNIPVSVCGEMASDPLVLRLLIACGLTEFSMTPGALPMARAVVQETNTGEMARIAARVLTLGTVDEIEQFLLEAFGRHEVHTP